MIKEIKTIEALIAKRAERNWNSVINSLKSNFMDNLCRLHNVAGSGYLKNDFRVMAERAISELLKEIVTEDIKTRYLEYQIERESEVIFKQFSSLYELIRKETKES